jgi:hypothetical protein
VSFHNHGDDEVNPIASTAAFAHFQQGHADRREGGVDQQTAELVGALSPLSTEPHPPPEPQGLEVAMSRHLTGGHSLPAQA